MRVLFFARARDLAGVAEFDVDAPAATVADLRRALTDRFPKLASFLPHCAIAVNDEYADETTPLTADSRAAVLPPVSGG